MNKSVLFVICIGFAFLTGCQESQELSADQIQSGQDLITVNFQKDRPVTYKITTSREVELTLEGGEDAKKMSRNKQQKMKETLEAVITYQPVELDPYGLSTIEAVCDSVKVTRKSFSGKNQGKDIAEQFKGKTYRFQISPIGKMSQLESFNQLIETIGAKSINERGKQGRIKEPEMIWDWAIPQLTMWDAISTIPDPLSGVKIGKTWSIEQLVAMPMPIPIVRNTAYTVQDIAENESGKQVMLSSTLSLSSKTFQDFPDAPQPFTGSFRMKGMFGFLRNYQFESLQGSGQAVFDMTSGELNTENYDYTLRILADFLLPLGDSTPVLTITQKTQIENITDRKE